MRNVFLAIHVASDVPYRVRLVSFVLFFLCSVSLVLLTGFDSISNLLFAAVRFKLRSDMS